jgi:hypothetical protein
MLDGIEAVAKKYIHFCGSGSQKSKINSHDGEREFGNNTVITY